MLPACRHAGGAGFPTPTVEAMDAEEVKEF